MSSLAGFVKDTGVRWFHFGYGDYNRAEVITEAGFEEEPNKKYADMVIFSLKLAYVNKTDLNNQMTATARRVMTKKGKKASLPQDDESIDRIVARQSLCNWRGMNAAAFRLLRAEFDFSRLDEAQEFEFERDNLTALINHSDLPDVASNAASSYELWYGETEQEAEEEAVKNSETGQSSNTDEQPAQTA